MPPPDGPILALSTADMAEKEAIFAAGTPGVFTIPHFNGFKGHLIQLEAISPGALGEAIADAWLSRASPSVADAFLQGQNP